MKQIILLVKTFKNQIFADMVNSQESVDDVDTQALLVQNEMVAPAAQPRPATTIKHTNDIRKLNVRLFSQL